MNKKAIKMEEVKNVQLRNADKETVNVLKELLESAEKGDLRSIVFIDKYHNNKVGSGWCGAPDERMLGELRLVETDLSIAILNSRGLVEG